MYKSIILAFLFCSLVLSSSFTTLNDSTNDPELKIQWMSWEEAVELSNESPKKIFIDVYTDWCGWCKRMDKTTFLDPEVMKELGDNFYAVKLNAEQKEDIVFQDQTFKFIKSGRRGYHQLAQALLDGRMGYPSFVLLDETFSRIMIAPGYKKPDEMMKQLEFASNETYKTMSWEEFSRQKS